MTNKNELDLDTILALHEADPHRQWNVNNQIPALVARIRELEDWIAVQDDAMNHLRAAIEGYKTLEDTQVEAALREGFEIAQSSASAWYPGAVEFNEEKLEARIAELRVKDTSVTPSSGNVFRDLELPNPELQLKLSMAKERIEELESAIRGHRDQRGDDRCWMDDEKLYEALPEGVGESDRRLCDPTTMLKNCEKYIASRHDPSLAYLSPQRQIEDLEARIRELETVKQENVEKLDETINAMLHKDDAPCYFCDEKTNSLAGDPSEWPLVFAYNSVGFARRFHIKCIVERLNKLEKYESAAWDE